MDKFDKLKLASSSFSERLKTSGSQMTRLVSSKMKDLLQTPTPESKMVDEATSETIPEPNWGLNLRICAMINAQQLSGTEVVKAIKKKLVGKSASSQRLSLDLLETCASNCEKVFSEVASEKVLDDMVRMIDDPKTDHGNRVRALQLIRAWGESEDLMYLPVFHQTYTSLKTRGTPEGAQDGTPYTLESYVHQQPMAPPDPDTGLHGADHNTFPYGYESHSIEGNKELLVVTRNSLDILSSILNSETEPIPIKDELTVSLLGKCNQSLPAVQRIAESTTDDEAMLFEALNLHDELRQVISKYDEIEAALESGGGLQQTSGTADVSVVAMVENHGETQKEVARKTESTQSSSEVKKSDFGKEDC